MDGRGHLSSGSTHSHRILISRGPKLILTMTYGNYVAGHRSTRA